MQGVADKLCHSGSCAQPLYPNYGSPEAGHAAGHDSPVWGFHLNPFWRMGKQGEIGGGVGARLGRIEIGFFREESAGLRFPEGKGVAFPFREAPRFRIRSRWGENSVVYGSKPATARCGRLLMSGVFGKRSELRGLSRSLGGVKRLILRLFGSIPKYLAGWIVCCWFEI